MALPETSCPQCGRPTAAGQQCGHCGHATASTPWFQVGQTYDTLIDPAAVGVAVEADTIQVTLEFAELWESYERRRVLLAHPLAFSHAGGEPIDSAALDTLEHRSFVVEQEETYARSEYEVLPEDIEASVRKPLTRERHNGKVVSVFTNDSGLALDEVVEVASNRLNLAQIRGIYLPVLDAVADLHERGMLHLRLTPWTLRVRDPSDSKGLPLAFLRDSMEEGQPVPHTAGLGDEETFSEIEEDAVPADADQTSEFVNDFAASREADKTRDDLMPLVMADFPSRVEESEPVDTDSFFATQSEASLGVEDEAADLEVLFDSVEGFFKFDGSFDEVPIIRGFSPPEMMGRSQVDITESCDVFNLGMLLYFLVAGQLPPVSVYTRHIPAIPARNLRPSFPPGLQSVIGRATRPDPNERYPSVDSLKRAFERACEVMQKRAELPGGKTPRMMAAVDTHVGIAKQRRNPTNQDAVFGAVSDDRRFSLMVVADGVSTASYGSGDLASSVLAEEAELAWEELHPSYLMDEAINPTAAIQNILNRANDRIVDYVNEHFLPFRGGPHEVMGTTALVAMLHDGMVTLATLGDSRVYLHRGEAFEQLTIDHNLWTLSILEGIPADNALAMPHGDALARCLGTFIIENERLEAVNPEPDVFQFPVTSGDTLLLTTDGLVDFASANMLTAEDLIHQVLVSEPDPALACLELILLANRGGGGDNIGVGIVKFV
ncbi:hypothetical protein FIV42_27125 [Persicimonas caeni]|uniref:PPM-type phosphatase domain-containing protein n=1 Tax=Persicimonas caeni TaxID=2292766 RepID=A0A4Y6Q132_PERCE|nr:protein phosphatase 2C domain-containing protein [Persicimonas caeni]QDG54284.1 hypothetical protein FIV42_27125 [Persicimonas caeni]QED35505.1 SpoIIE family protein phosphatase [Persicimonas caeni]